MPAEAVQSFSNSHTTNNRLLLFFALGWVLLNGWQAACIGIDADEAYYWGYAQHLQWGYFDHPPLVALCIRLGEAFGHGPFYTRLVAVLLSGGTVYVGFKLLPPPLQDTRLYVLIFASAVLLQAYGFIATPDAPLLFFTTLFFYAYKRFLERETIAYVLLLSLSITGLLYSKYHGVLPVFFTLLSHPKLLLKPSAWAAAVLAFLLFGPHLWWQHTHDWPTVRYHLWERISSRYTFVKTANYIALQLLVWGPFTSIPALYYFSKIHVRNLYERAHLFTLWGVFLFFLLSSFRSSIEMHWTLVAGPSFVLLLLRVLHSTPRLKKTVVLLCSITAFLIFTARILFILPGTPVEKLRPFETLFYAKTWANTLHRVAQGRPVVFIDSYRLPALYRYHHPAAKTFGYTTVKYRKTQFDLYSDSALNNQPVLLAGMTVWPEYTHFFKTPYDTIFLQRLPAYKSVRALKMVWQQPVAAFKGGETPMVVVTVQNTGKDSVSTSGLAINYTFLESRGKTFAPGNNIPFAEPFLPPGYEKKVLLKLQPPREPESYHLVFSVVQPPMAGSFASPFYNVQVE